MGSSPILGALLLANFVLGHRARRDLATVVQGSVEPLFDHVQSACTIQGEKNTFCIVHNGEDVIASIGYACLVDGRSARESLSTILARFDESQIGDFKKRLIGQFILIIKKGNFVHIFSDFMGSRNVFYSQDDKGAVFSSSFQEIEKLIEAGPADLDMHKVLEFLAVKHILYPAWLGSSTVNRRINWLRPNQYVSIDLMNSKFRLGSVTYFIDNRKNADFLELAQSLNSNLSEIINRGEFKNSLVAATLTGGRDSRLVAAITARSYDKVHFRTAASAHNYDSRMDSRVAEKIARIAGIPHDRYDSNRGLYDDKFAELTERLSPVSNQIMTSLILNTDKYAVGFGGIYGTELFRPVPWKSIDAYINGRIEYAKKFLCVGKEFWNTLRNDICEEFQCIKAYYRLTEDNESDYIRLFDVFLTARFGSFIISAFNYLGYQIEPYGSYKILELALQVSPEHWGNRRRICGDAGIRAGALSLINEPFARVLTYKAYRPMLPLSYKSLHLYIYGYVRHAIHWLRERLAVTKVGRKRVNLPDGLYLSSGWDTTFLRRTADIYQANIHSPDS